MKQLLFETDCHLYSIPNCSNKATGATSSVELVESESLAQRACHLGGQYWNYYTGALFATHQGRVTHICGNDIIGSDNGLAPTNAGILLIAPLGTNFSEKLIETFTFSFKKMHLRMSSGIRQPFCLGLNVLRQVTIPTWKIPTWTLPI